MSAEEEVKTNETTPEIVVEGEGGESENVDMRTEQAGSTPFPEPDSTTNDNVENVEEAQPENDQDGGGVPASAEDPAPSGVPPADGQEQDGLGYAQIPQVDPLQQAPPHQHIPPTINHTAIVASAQNKLPVSKVKGIVLRLGRHTESSGQKTGKFFKNENYVDKDSYSWKNMSLFEDHQCHLWTPSGTVRGSYKK